MVIQLTILLLSLGNIAFAQIGPTPTRFDKFVNKPKIQWAAYASDTFNFDQAGLNNLLRNRLVNKKIKASLPVESRTASANKINYTSIDSIDKKYFPEQDGVVKKIDTAAFVLTEITQVLYIENGQLKSYIPFITPTLPVYMSTGKYLGESFYFSTAFNNKYNYKPRKRNKLHFLGQTKRMLKLDPLKNRDQLKTMYGKNLLETLWPYVLENKIDAFAFDNNRKLKPEELNINLSYDQPVIAPVYDSVGNVMRFEVLDNPISTEKFTDVQLIQDWYYDAKKNKVISEFRYLVLYVSKFSKTELKDPVPAIKLVFK